MWNDVVCVSRSMCYHKRRKECIFSAKKDSRRVEQEKFIEETRLLIGNVKLPIKARAVVPGHVVYSPPETRKVVWVL